MSCCPSISKTFFNEEATTITYPQSYKALYGPIPTIKVLYLQDGEYIEGTGFLTNIAVNSEQIVINHGGPASGVIKIN